MNARTRKDVVYRVLVATPACTHLGRENGTLSIARRARVTVRVALAALRDLRRDRLVLMDAPVYASFDAAIERTRWARTSDAEDLLHSPGLEAIRDASR